MALELLKIMIEHNHEWDAGELGCGELVLGVRKRLRAHPGQVLRLIALDTGAAVDLQAFCNMTGDVRPFRQPPMMRSGFPSQRNCALVWMW